MDFFLYFLVSFRRLDDDVFRLICTIVASEPRLHCAFSRLSLVINGMLDTWNNFACTALSVCVLESKCDN